MSKSWYVIHTYAGYEGRVKVSIVERANQMGLGESVGQVLVPTEDVIEKKWKTSSVKAEVFPRIRLGGTRDPYY